MNSPARASYQRKLAMMAASTAGTAHSGRAAPMPEKGPVASEYQLLLAALGEDLRRLHGIQSVEKKIEAKRAMIARYSDWVQGALDADAGAQDEIVSTMLIWSIDLGAWASALDLADYVLRHGIDLPERYKRQPAVLVAEEFAEAGLKSEPAIGYPFLQQIAALTADADMPDQVRAKLEKAQGLALKAQADAFDPEAESAPAGGKAALIEAALAHFRRALALDKNSGVKKLIEGLERELKKLAEPPAG